MDDHYDNQGVSGWLGSPFDGGSFAATFAEQSPISSAMWEAVRPNLESFQRVASESYAMAMEPFGSFSAWAGTSNLSALAGMNLADSSAAARLADSLDFTSSLALSEASNQAWVEMSGIAATFDRVSLEAFGPLHAQLTSFEESFASSIPVPESLVSGVHFPSAPLHLTKFAVPIAVNPLLDPMIGLAATNVEMHRRLQEMTVLNREIRDEVASLREWQAESDKGAERWTRREVGIAFVALLVSIAAIVISVV